MPDGDGTRSWQWEWPDPVLSQMIRRQGHSVEYIPGSDERQRPSTAYTIGLFGLGHPELLVFGLTSAYARVLLDDLAGRVRQGTDIPDGSTVVVRFEPTLVTQSIVVESVSDPGSVVLRANAFYGQPSDRSVPVNQLVYDDFSGRFPWDDGYCLPAWAQPRSGASAA